MDAGPEGKVSAPVETQRLCSAAWPRLGLAEGLERMSRPADSFRQIRNYLTAENSEV